MIFFISASLIVVVVGRDAGAPPGVGSHCLPAHAFPGATAAFFLVSPLGVGWLWPGALGWRRLGQLLRKGTNSLEKWRFCARKKTTSKA
jgi:hypothetical protein